MIDFLAAHERYGARQQSFVLAGRGELGDDRTFQIDFSGRLSAGSYFVLAEIIVNGSAMEAKIERIPLTISSSS
jgi:hypothetical protein